MQKTDDMAGETNIRQRVLDELVDEWVSACVSWWVGERVDVYVREFGIWACWT